MFYNRDARFPKYRLPLGEIMELIISVSDVDQSMWKLNNFVYFHIKLTCT